MSEISQTATKSATKTGKGNATKKAAKPKVAKAKTAKAPKPKKERTPREDRRGWKTFAFRMPEAESATLHESAGKANGSKVMRALAAAFVAGDAAAFKQIVDDAKKLQ